MLHPDEESSLEITADARTFVGTKTKSFYTTVEQGETSQTFVFTVTCEVVPDLK